MSNYVQAGDEILGLFDSSAFLLSFQDAFFQLAQLLTEIASKNKLRNRMPPTFETKVCISLVVPAPPPFYFAAAFLFFRLTASTLSPPTPNFPFQHSSIFGGCLGCFGHFLGNGSSIYEQNSIGLQGIKKRHIKNPHWKTAVSFM